MDIDDMVMLKYKLQDAVCDLAIIASRLSMTDDYGSYLSNSATRILTELNAVSDNWQDHVDQLRK